MNSGSSASISSQGQSADAAAIRSCHQKSRPSFISTSNSGLPATRCTTMQVSTGMPISSSAEAMAASATGFIRIGLSPRWVPLQVTTVVQVESTMRSDSESAEKPPKTMEWTAPMRAQASMATASSGTIGR